MVERTPRSFLTVANALTFSRLLLLPVIVVAVTTRHGWLAVGAMALVLLTDLLDGRLARRLGQASAFGKALDSTVDFVLIYSLFIAFYAAGRIASYQFLLLYLAMLSILLLQFTQPAAGGEPASTRFGKPTGALQYLFLLLLVIREPFPDSRALLITTHILFAFLAAAIVLNTIECLSRLWRLTRSASAE